jgi:hypothetical protein
MFEIIYCSALLFQDAHLNTFRRCERRRPGCVMEGAMGTCGEYAAYSPQFLRRKMDPQRLHKPIARHYLLQVRHIARHNGKKYCRSLTRLAL